MNRTIKKTISSFLILGFLLNVVLPIKEASAMTGPWWSGSQVHDSTGVASSPPGGSFNDNRKNQEQAGEPVSVHNGDFIYQHQDRLIPSRGMPLEIIRTYKSQSRYNNRFGYGWDVSYNKKIVPLCTGDLYYLNGKLNRYRFIYVDGTNYISPKGVYDIMVQNVDGTYTLTEKHGTAYEFDQNGVLTEIRDRNGNSLHFSYDPDGKLPIIGKSVFSNDPNPKVIAYNYKLIKITDTAGREITLNYNSNGRQGSIVDFSGRACTYTYDPSDNGDLISFTTPATEGYPAGLTTTYSYTDHNLETITDAKGQTYLTNYYDASDRVYQQQYGAGTFVFSYDTANNRTTITDPKGFVAEWSYDSNGSPISKREYTTGLRPTDPVFYTTTYQYNNNNLERTSITYPTGNGIKYTYDDKGNLLKTTRKPNPETVPLPDDIVTTFTYEPNYNFIKTIADPEGNTTTYYYDYEETTLGDLNGDGITTGTNGNLVKIGYPVVDSQTPTTLFTYNAYGQVETVTDPNGIVTKYVYYSSTGYLKQTINDFGEGNLNYTTEMTYDSVGNVTSIENARGYTTTFVYSALNQLTKTISSPPSDYQTKYSYDENGNLVRTERQADDAGTLWQSTDYTYTNLDQLETITDDLGNVTTFSYDANGNRTSIQDAESNTTTYVYDERDLLWKVTDALGNTTEYAYDENGNLKEIKDAKENVTTYEYSDFGQLTNTTYPDLSYEEYTYDANSNLVSKRTRKDDIINYTYDNLNRLDLKTYPDNSTVDYVYDIASRLTSVTEANGTISYVYDALNRVTGVNNYGKTVGYEYDAVGNRTKLTYSDNTYISYEYDELNRITIIKDETSNTVASYGYDTLSRRAITDLANGTGTDYTYDNVNRLLNLLNEQRVSSIEISSFGYGYDNVGNRTSMTTQDGTHNYSYDNIYQLTNVDYPDGFAFPDMTYNYDDVGNRLSTVNGGTATYVPDEVNQYESVGGVTYTYDDNGNLASDGTNTYTYDYENRLLQATSSTLQANYKYDAFGRRIEKDVDGSITKFIYDGDQVIAEYDGSETLLRKFVYGAGIDEPILLDDGTNKYYYHFDGLGSVTEIMDSSGDVVEEYSYDVYGEPSTTSSIDNPYYFTGRRYDAETGLYYYRARYYSPSIGRFLQRDPITWASDDPRISYKDHLFARINRRIVRNIGTSDPQRLHRYTYVFNNPVCWIDPLGFYKEREKHLIWYLDISVSGMVPWFGGGGPWGSAGISAFYDPQAEGWLNKIGFGPHYAGGGGIGGELDVSIGPGVLYGESIRSAEGLGNTTGGSGAALHGGSLNVSRGEGGVWSVDVSYTPGIAGETHIGRIRYPQTFIPGPD